MPFVVKYSFLLCVFDSAILTIAWQSCKFTCYLFKYEENSPWFIIIAILESSVSCLYMNFGIQM